MLISDEVFSEMVYDGENEGTTTGTSRPAARNSSVPVFTLNGISKMFASPDLKLAWIAVTGARTVTADLLDRLETANDTFLSCTSLSQHILPGLFERGANLPRQMTDVLRTNRDQLLASCGVPVSRPPQMGEKAVPLRGEGGLRIVPPTGGIHAVIGVPRSAASPWIDDEDLAVTLLRERELYVHPGYFYGIEERENEIYLVVSFLKKHDLLAEGLSRLASFVSGRHRSPTI
jgi:aspartate/methionine/tyrosine aminotransferase